MAGTNVQSLVSNVMTARLSTVENLSQSQQQTEFGENFSDVMNKASEKTSEVQTKPETNSADNSIKDEIEKSKEFSKKLEEVDKNNEKIAMENGAEQSQAENITDNVNALKNTIADKFNISVEELEMLMQEMNIEDYQLFDTNIIAKLVVEVNGLASIQELLLNSEAMQTFKDIVSEMENIRMELGAQGIEVTQDGFVQSETGEIIDMTSSVMMEEVDDTGHNSEIKQNITDDSLNNEMQQNVEISAIDENTDETQNLNNLEDVKETTGTKIKEAETQMRDNANDNMSDADSKGENKNSNINVDGNVAALKFTPVENIEQILTERVGRNQAESIVNQIMEQIKININNEFKSMELQLYPEHLGKVEIQVIAKNGMVTAQIIAETETVKNALEAQLTSLKENMNNQGLKVENVEVTVASHNSMQQDTASQNGQSEEKQGKRSRKLDVSFLDGTNEILTEEEEEKTIMETLGNTVSYQA